MGDGPGIVWHLLGFEKDPGEKYVDGYEFTGLSLEDACSIVGLPPGHPMWDTYPVDAEAAVRLERWVGLVVDTTKLDFVLERRDAIRDRLRELQAEREASQREGAGPTEGGS